MATSPTASRIAPITSGVVTGCARRQPGHWSRQLIPGRRVPWLAVESDPLFHISSKVLVDDRVRAAGFHGCDHLGDLAPANRRRLDHSYGPVILLHDDLDALPDFGQHGMHVAREFGFCNPDRRHIMMIRLLSPYTLTVEAARAIPSTLSSNSNPAVRGLWWLVYQR